MSWSSKKQSVVSRTSMKSKYCALPSLASEISRIKSLLKEIQFPLQKLPMQWCDNMSTRSLASNLVFHARTKHVEIDVHFIWNKVLAKEIVLGSVPSSSRQ